MCWLILRLNACALYTVPCQGGGHFNFEMACLTVEWCLYKQWVIYCHLNLYEGIPPALDLVHVVTESCTR